MPAKVAKRGPKHRVIEPSGKTVKGPSGKSVDGGGHATKAAAQRQASAINISQARKRGAKIPKR